MIELTPPLQKALEETGEQTLRLIDPRTRNTYILLPESVYHKMTAEKSHGELTEADGTTMEHVDRSAHGFEIPPGIRCSQEAFWRDLPGLLKGARPSAGWALYHGEQRLGTGDYTALIRECKRRGLSENEFYLGRIEPRDSPPWEPEEVEPIGPHHLED
jgi:hypothetical protein